MYKEHAGGGARDIPGWEIQKSFDYIASICKYILATATLSILFLLVLLLLITIVIISVVIVIDGSVTQTSQSGVGYPDVLEGGFARELHPTESPWRYRLDTYPAGSVYQMGR